MCGEVFQTDFDRFPHRFATYDTPIPIIIEYATSLRKLWSQRHARTHTEREHVQLVLSGRWLTPEAAYRLAAFGVISIGDLVLDDEIAAAYKESSPVPKNDAEGT